MNESTLQRLKQLKFYGMFHSFKAVLEQGRSASLTADELISLLVESEWDDRNNRRIDRNLRNARFRYRANMDQVHYDPERQIDRNLLMRLADCSFLGRAENVLITGSTGTGKSYIASALGNQACTLGYKVLYSNTTKLITRLRQAKADGSYIREMNKIEKLDLLLLDDFALQPFDAFARSTLMEMVEDRHGKKSTVVASQIPVALWHSMIGEETVADAIMDRLVHDAHRLALMGESLRKRRKMVAETDEQSNESIM